MITEVLIICVTIYALFSDYISARAELISAEAEYREQQARALELANNEKEYDE